MGEAKFLEERTVISLAIVNADPTRILSITAAMPGTSSWISLGASCPSACVNGRMGTHQWDMVLQKRALDHSYANQNLLALRAATTEGVQLVSAILIRGDQYISNVLFFIIIPHLHHQLFKIQRKSFTVKKGGAEHLLSEPRAKLSKTFEIRRE